MYIKPIHLKCISDIIIILGPFIQYIIENLIKTYLIIIENLNYFELG